MHIYLSKEFIKLACVQIVRTLVSHLKIRHLQAFGQKYKWYSNIVLKIKTAKTVKATVI